MVWSLSLDDFNQICKNTRGTYPLTRAIARTLREDENSRRPPPSMTDRSFGMPLPDESTASTSTAFNSPMPSRGGVSQVQPTISLVQPRPQPAVPDPPALPPIGNVRVISTTVPRIPQTTRVVTSTQIVPRIPQTFTKVRPTIPRIFTTQQPTRQPTRQPLKPIVLHTRIPVVKKVIKKTNPFTEAMNKLILYGNKHRK